MIYDAMCVEGFGSNPSTEVEIKCAYVVQEGTKHFYTTAGPRLGACLNLDWSEGAIEHLPLYVE